jgi:hypothetical protein
MTKDISSVSSENIINNVELTTSSIKSDAPMFVGTDFNDYFRSAVGDEIFLAGSGIDTMIYSGPRSNYTLTKVTQNFALAIADWIVTSTTEGKDMIKSVERISFTNTNLALDIDGNAGMAYRIYQAALNRSPDKFGLGYWMAVLDQGKGLTTVAEGFVNSNEFKSLYGANPSNAVLVTQFYQNVLHREPDKAGYDWWLNELDTGHQTVVQVLIGFSESRENKTKLVGLIENGIEYMPWGV